MAELDEEISPFENLLLGVQMSRVIIQVFSTARKVKFEIGQTHSP